MIMLAFSTHLFPYTTLFRSGVGPALIKTFAIEVDGKKVGGEIADQVETALRILFPRLDWKLYQGYFGVGYMMAPRSEEHTSELQSLRHLVCRLLLEKKIIYI